MEHKKLIESAENTLDRIESLDRSASGSVETSVDISRGHLATASDCINQNSSNDVEMVTIGSNEKPLGPKEMELMDLNDDCLSAIFKHLPLLDLSSVADVCKRSRSIAQQNFWLAKPIVKIPQDLVKFNENIVDDGKVEIIQRLFRIFQNFGSLMTALDVEYTKSVEYDDKICALILEHCGEKLTSLKLELPQIQSLPIGMRSIFNNLKKLDFYSVHGIDASVLGWLTDVEDLALRNGIRRVEYGGDEIYHESDEVVENEVEMEVEEEFEVDICSEFFEHSFNKLQRIHLETDRIDGHKFALFLNENQTLKEINISVSDFSPAFMIPTQTEKLHLHIKTGPVLFSDTSFRCIEVNSFRNAKKLRSLKLLNDYPTIEDDYESEVIAILREIIAGDIPLKHFILGGKGCFMEMTSERFCNKISELVHLNTLELDGWMYQNMNLVEQLSSKLHRLNDFHFEIFFTQLSVDEIVTFIGCFPNLQRLRVHYPMGHQPKIPLIFDSEHFEKLVAIVEIRNNNTRLDIVLDEYSYKTFIPNDLAQKHCHILTVTLSKCFKYF